MSKISLTEKIVFTKHLGVMIKAGIPLAEALSTIENDATNNTLKKVISDLKNSVESGQSLSKSIQKHQKTFDHIYQNLISIGEESGKLDDSLHLLATQLSKVNNLRNKIQTALIYPGLVVGLLFVVGGAISIFILPKLVDFFSAFGQDLPISTRILLSIANFMKNYGIIFFVSIIALLMFIYYLVNYTQLKRYWDRLVFHLPFLGKFLTISQIAILSRNMSALISSGVTLFSGLETLINGQNNFYLKKNLSLLQSGLKSGQPISQTIKSQKLYIFPSLFEKMVSVGEQTGKLDEMLLYLAEYYEEELETASKNLTTTLEPILLIIVGLMVGFLALAIISPIYQITGSIGGL